MRSRFTLFAAFLVLSGLFTWYASRAAGQGGPPSFDKHKDFQKVQGILQQYCFECHGKGKIKGDFNITVMDQLKARALPEKVGEQAAMWERLTSKDENAVM